MRQHRLSVAIFMLCGILFWTGCFPGVLHTDHEYVLVVEQGQRLMQLADDDPLYAQFDEIVLSDPDLDRLLIVYEHTTEAFIATNEPTALSQTIANLPVIVLDGSQVGVLRDVTVGSDDGDIRVELAIGLGLGGARDLALARQRFAPAMAPALLYLMGVKLPDDEDSLVGPLYEITDATTALARGFAAALQALDARDQRIPHGAAEPEGAWADASAIQMADLVARNGYRYLYDGTVPTDDLRSMEQAVQTPGVVATYFYRLFDRATGYYPQHHMLWFANYEGDEVVHGKLMLALGRMPRGEPASIDVFIDAYGETFPSERDALETLYRETFGTALSWNEAR